MYEVSHESLLESEINGENVWKLDELSKDHK